MCDKQEAKDSNPDYRATANQVSMPRESHMVYELKQKREYHIQQLVIIQKAIDALNMVGGLY